MAQWTVKFYTGNYPDRQKQANSDKAICYLEGHFNASDNPRAGGIEIIIADNASRATRKWAEFLVTHFNFTLQTRIRHVNGIKEVSKGERGWKNIFHTKMPAVLIEPLFITNPKELKLFDEKKDTLAYIIAGSIKTIFPDGGLIGLSIGHKGKESNPNDKGAKAVDGRWEADLVEKLLLGAKNFFEDRNKS